MRKKITYGVVGLLLIASLVSCSTPSLRQARNVVAQADSLWQNGQSFSDSAQLAQAYETMTRWQWIYADEYAHACYHYGKLLREKDNPVAAMQSFINATHSRSHDYQILGRVYNNVADIAHWGKEYALSYDMFEMSADIFLRSGDTLLYYYGLNNMAFEKAMLLDTVSVFSLLSYITTNCHDTEVRTKTYETLAETYLRTQQYDSALHYASICCDRDSSPLSLVLKAQIYSYQGKKDSAVFYAEQVLLVSTDLSDIHNALYILTNEDQSKDRDAIRKTAADRADTQKLIEIRQGKLSQAVQLLEQDLQRKPNLTWLYAIFLTICAIGIIIAFYVYRKKRQHQLLAQQLADLQQASTVIQKKHNDLSTRYLTHYQRIENEISNTCLLIRENGNIPTDLEWKDFEPMCKIIDRHFHMLASKLRQKQCLNETELRLCVLVLLDMSRTEIADTLPYALSSVGKLKDQTAKLLGTTGKNLRKYLINLAVEG